MMPGARPPARSFAYALAEDVDAEVAVAPPPAPPVKHPVRSMAVWIARFALVLAWAILAPDQTIFSLPEPPPAPRHPALFVPELQAGASQRRARGRRLFHSDCQPCHGPVADGNGLRAVGLKLRPADLRAPSFLVHSTSETLFWTIREGVPGTPMAGWPELSDDDTWALVAWIRSGTP